MSFPVPNNLSLTRKLSVCWTCFHAFYPTPPLLAVAFLPIISLVCTLFFACRLF